MELRSLLLTLALVASGCAASVSRIGYEPPPPRTSVSGLAESVQPNGLANACPVLITADTNAIASVSAEPLGRIRYRDSGFSTRCDEAAALRLFQSDACALGANVVLITAERGPDFWSTCYRAEAHFYVVPDSSSLVAVADRRSPDRLVFNRGAGSGDQLLWVLSSTAGTLGGLLLASVLFGGN